VKLHLSCQSTFQEMLNEENSNYHLNLMSKVLNLRKRTVGLVEILKVQQLVSYVLCISSYSLP